MRILTLAAVLVLAVAAVGAWVVEAEPDWYLRARYPLEYEQILRTHGANHDLDPALVAAVVYVESRFDPNAESEAGAIGLMQLLPDTAEGIALRTGGSDFVTADLRDPDINVRYGTWYLEHLYRPLRRHAPRPRRVPRGAGERRRVAAHRRRASSFPETRAAT